MPPADLTIRLLTHADLPAYKALRDIGLQHDPEAFTSDFDTASALPPATYATRLGQFLPNPDNVYLLHAPGRTVFAGRREAFMAEAEAHGLSLRRIEQFTQRDGEPLFEVWRAMPPE